MKAPTSIAELVPAPWNPREMDDEARKGLQNSMDEFGDLSGLVWNATTKHLVTGAQRMAALRDEHGEENLFIDSKSFETPRILSKLGPAWEGMPIRVVEWSIQKERAANVAANNPAIQGRFTDGLGAVLSDVKRDFPKPFEALRLGELAALEEQSKVIAEVVAVLRDDVEYLRRWADNCPEGDVMVNAAEDVETQADRLAKLAE